MQEYLVISINAIKLELYRLYYSPRTKKNFNRIQNNKMIFSQFIHLMMEKDKNKLTNLKTEFQFENK